jgi:hypothetical protein
MNGHEVEPQPACPKLTWVLAQLTDDETIPDVGDLPHGLRFHLDRCPTCGSIARRIVAVRHSLDALSVEEPPAYLAVQADDQVEAALMSGAVPGSPLMLLNDNADLPPRSWTLQRLSARFVPWAAAAAVVFLVGSLLWPALNPSEPGAAARRPFSPVPPSSALHVGEADLEHFLADAPRMVLSDWSGDVPPRRARRTARSGSVTVTIHADPVDAAFSNDPGGFQAAFTLPAGALPFGDTEIDTTAELGLTTWAPRPEE